MTIRYQVSIGHNSLGLAYRDVEAAEMAGLIEQSANDMGYTAEVVESKLRNGGTLWLNRAEGRKIRGYDPEAATQRTIRQHAERAQRRAADGYFDDK